LDEIHEELLEEQLKLAGILESDETESMEDDNCS